MSDWKIPKKSQGLGGMPMFLLKKSTVTRDGRPKFFLEHSFTHLHCLLVTVNFKYYNTNPTLLTNGQLDWARNQEPQHMLSHQNYSIMSVMETFKIKL